MADETATLALGIDSSGFEAGAQRVARSAQEIRTASAGAAAGTDQLQQSLGATAATLGPMENAYKGAIGASDMASDAAYRAALATEQERVAFDATLKSGEALALEHQRLAQSMDQMAGSASGAAGAVNAVEPATRNAFGGTNRLVRSMDTMALSAVGVHGPISTIVSSLGMLSLGSPVMIGVAAAAAAIAVAWELLTGKATKLRQETDKLVASLAKQEEQRLGITATKDVDETSARVATLTTKYHEAQAAVAGYATLQAATFGTPTIIASLGDLKDHVADVKKELDKATEAQHTANRALGKFTDDSAQQLDMLRAVAGGHKLSATQLQELTDIYDTYTGRIVMGQAALAKLTRGSAEYDAANKDVIALINKQDEAFRLLEAQHKSSTKSTNDLAKATADMAEAQARDTVETLRASGDMVGATQAQLALDLVKIATRDQLLGQSLKMKQSDIDAKIAHDQNAASVKAQTTIEAERDAQRKLFAAAAAKISEQTATDTKLQAQLDGDGKAVFDDVYADKIAKIQDTTAKQIAANDANKNLIDGMAFGLDVQALVNAALAIHGVELQKDIDLKKEAAAGTKFVTEQEMAFQVALLKSSGQAKEAAAIEAQGRLAVLKVRLDELVAVGKLTQSDENSALFWATQREQILQTGDVVAKLTTIEKTQMRDLATGIKGAFETTFNDIVTKGLASFGGLFDQIKALFLKMIGQLAAAEMEKSLLGPLSGALGLRGGGGSTSGGGLTPDPFSGGAGQLGTFTGVGETVTAGSTFASVIPYIAAAGIALGVLGGILGGESQAAKDAAASNTLMAQSLVTLQTATDAYTNSLASFRSSFIVSGTSAVDTLAKIAKGSTDLVAQAEKAAPGWANYEKMSTDAIQGLLNGLSDLPPSMRQFLQALLDIRSATNDANAALRTTFLGTVQTDFVASLGAAGQAVANVTAMEDKRNKALADAAALGLGADTTGTIQATFANNAKTFFASLTTSGLDTLLPTLTGDTLAWATAIDQTKHAVDDAATAQRNAANANTLAMRAATDAGDTATIRFLTKQNEVAQAIASGWSAADIAWLKQIQTSEDAKTATDAVVAAEAKLTTARQAAAAFDLTLEQRAAKLSGNPAAIYQANFDTAFASFVADVKTLSAEYAAGTISGAKYTAGMKVLNADLTSAANSFDGTIGGVTQSVHDLAVQAQILAGNVTQLNQQWTVMGTSLAQQVTDLRSLYGFGAQSDAQIRSRYTLEQNGTALTPSQQTLNDNIANYFKTENAYLASIVPAAQAAAVAVVAAVVPKAATPTATSSSPILAPGGTVNITVNVVAPKDVNPTQLGRAIIQGMRAQLDAENMRRTSLVLDATGQG